MVPDSIRPGTASSGERRLFNRFRKELPDDYVVLHSLGITTHKNKIWAEADFVILTTGGIFVIEVKSGGVACEDGRWIFSNGKGNKHEKYEGPFSQASSAMYAVRNLIEEDNSLKGMLYGYGVIMPDENFRQKGSEIELGVLLNSSQFHKNLGEYLDHLVRFWFEKYSEKHRRDPRFPSKEMLEKSRNILRPDITSAFTLSSALSKIEKEQIELTEEQGNLLRRMDDNPRTLIRGGAGTGKTLLAADKAKRLAESGASVLFLCYNRLLGDHIREALGCGNGDSRLEAWSIHNWFGHIIDKAGFDQPVQDPDMSDDTFFQEIYPQLYMDAVVELEIEPFDVIIVDEGQDLLRENYLDALDLTLKNGLSSGSWHVFIDPNQNIFKSDIDLSIDRLEYFGVGRYALEVNCRNTVEIAIETSRLSGILCPLEGALEGGQCKTIFFSSNEAMISELEGHVYSLLGEGVSRKDIIILSRYQLANSVLAGTSEIAGKSINDMTKTRASARGSIDFCTIHGFKGLERRAVLAVDIVDLLNDESQLLNYCGLSRARSYLATFIQDNEKSSYKRLSREFGAKLAADATRMEAS